MAGVKFSKKDAARIAAAVRKIEQGDRSSSSPSVRASDDGAELVRGTFTGNWAKGATKTVTHATLSALTYEAKNYFAALTNATTKACCIAYVGGEWILIAAEC